MCRIYLIVLLLSGPTLHFWASAQGRYGLKTVSSLAVYDSAVAVDPRQALVDLSTYIPGIQLDIRYATADNLMKRPVYKVARAFLRLPAAMALRDIQTELNRQGYGLKIYDGYRPYSVTVLFYEQYHDTNFVASPYTGSRHNRGCAVDLTIVDLKTGREWVMPTSYDSFSKEASATYGDLSADVLKRRQFLQDIMIRHGFAIYPYEWWHFDFVGWNQFPVTDIPFEALH
jgi:zinc D-Ala-D-Ala dipeptidase